MYLNQLTVIGFTGQDADFHFTLNGTRRTTIRVLTGPSALYAVFFQNRIR